MEVFTLVVSILLAGNVIMVGSEEIGKGDDANGGSGDNVIFSFQNIAVSLAVMCTLIFVVVGCTWAWWQRVLCFWKKQGTHEAPPEWFVNAGLNSNSSIVTLDPSHLSRDTSGRASITIDPLPTLSELGLDGRDSFELRTSRTPGIVPLADEAEIHAHDWFQEPHKSFARGNLVYDQIVGKGWFGKVLQAKAARIKQYIEVSNVLVRELRANATEAEQIRFLDEARMFREAGNADGVLKLLGFCVDQMPYILIFECFPLGDLKSYLKGKARQAPSAEDGILTRMIIDIVRGLKWMHEAGFVHGDLAARNCLVATPAGKVVIGDYGFSTQKFREDYYWNSGYAIPIRWIAPEAVVFNDGTLQRINITQQANIWTLGVVIWEVFQFGKTPHANRTDEDIIERITDKRSLVLEPPQFPFLRESIRTSLYQIMTACWNSTPNHRPSIDAVEEVFLTPA